MNFNNYSLLLYSLKLCDAKVFEKEECQKDEKKFANGASMYVYKGKLYDLEVAIKIPKKKKEFKSVAQEIKIMSSIKHPNIITFHGVAFFDGKSEGAMPGLILELAEQTLSGYLSHFLDVDTPVDQVTKARFCYEILNGLQAIHDATVTFGDLKGENILICRINDIPVCKIGDFGYSATAKSISDKDFPGYTLHFAAPEVFGDNLKEFGGQACDIYSYGLVVWQIVRNGEIPFEGEDPGLIQGMKKEGDLNELYSLVFNELSVFREVIKAATHHIPNERSPLDKLKSMFEKEFPKIQEEWETINIKHEVYSNEPITHNKRERISSFHDLPSIPAQFKKDMFNFNMKLKTSSAKSELSIHYFYGFGVEKNIEEAIRLSKEAAEEGDPLSMYNYGYFLKFIRGNDEEANIWFEKASDKGDVEASLTLGHYYYEKEQSDEAVKYFEKAIKRYEDLSLGLSKGHHMKYASEILKYYIYQAILKVGNHYLVQKEFKRAREFYQHPFSYGNDYIHYQIGQTYEGTEEYDEAFRVFKMAAEEYNYDRRYAFELSDIHHCLMHAYWKNSKRSQEDKQYLKQIVDMGGKELQFRFAYLLIELEDKDEALEYFDKAADRGHVDAAFYGGHYHLDKEKYERAEELFLKIVKHQHLKREVSLQLGFVTSKTSKKEKLLESQHWFLKAAGVDVFDTEDDDTEMDVLAVKELKEKAINGNHDAQIAIVKKYPKKAIKWLSQAKKIDESIALALGVFCETGLLSTRNLEKAMKFYSRSDERGREHYKKLSSLKANLRNPFSRTALSSSPSCKSNYAKDEMVYNCINCCKNHTVLCSRCFYASKHQGHDVIVYFAPGDESTCCDCGDTELEGNTLCCQYHGVRPKSFRENMSDLFNIPVFSNTHIKSSLQRISRSFNFMYIHK